MATTRISEADAARDFAGLMDRVRLGEEIVIESEACDLAVVRSAVPAHGPGRLLSELIATAEARNSMVVLDEGFAQDMEEVIASHREPLDPPSWD